MNELRWSSVLKKRAQQEGIVGVDEDGTVVPTKAGRVCLKRVIYARKPRVQHTTHILHSHTQPHNPIVVTIGGNRCRLMMNGTIQATPSAATRDVFIHNLHAPKEVVSLHLPFSVSGHAAVRVEPRKVCIIGGWCPERGLLRTLMEVTVLDDPNSVYTLKPELVTPHNDKHPIPRMMHTAALMTPHSRKVLAVFGGWTSERSVSGAHTQPQPPPGHSHGGLTGRQITAGAGELQLTASLEFYDVQHSYLHVDYDVRNADHGPPARCSAASTALPNGTGMVVHGGYGANQTVLNDMWLLAPAPNALATLRFMWREVNLTEPVPRMAHTLVSVDATTLLVVGGYGSSQCRPSGPSGAASVAGTAGGRTATAANETATAEEPFDAPSGGAAASIDAPQANAARAGAAGAGDAMNSLVVEVNLDLAAANAAAAVAGSGCGGSHTTAPRPPSTPGGGAAPPQTPPAHAAGDRSSSNAAGETAAGRVHGVVSYDVSAGFAPGAALGWHACDVLPQVSAGWVGAAGGKGHPASSTTAAGPPDPSNAAVAPTGAAPDSSAPSGPAAVGAVAEAMPPAPPAHPQAPQPRLVVLWGGIAGAPHAADALRASLPATKFFTDNDLNSRTGAATVGAAAGVAMVATADGIINPALPTPPSPSQTSISTGGAPPPPHASDRPPPLPPARNAACAAAVAVSAAATTVSTTDRRPTARTLVRHIVNIQRIMRGHLARANRRLHEAAAQNREVRMTAAVTVQRVVRGWLVRSKSKSPPIEAQQQQQQEQAETPAPAHASALNPPPQRPSDRDAAAAAETLPQQQSQDHHTSAGHAALKIQKVVRGWLVRGAQPRGGLSASPSAANGPAGPTGAARSSFRAATTRSFLSGLASPSSGDATADADETGGSGLFASLSQFFNYGGAGGGGDGHAMRERVGAAGAAAGRNDRPRPRHAAGGEDGSGGSASASASASGTLSITPPLPLPLPGQVEEGTDAGPAAGAADRDPQEGRDPDADVNDCASVDEDIMLRASGSSPALEPNAPPDTASTVEPVVRAAVVGTTATRVPKNTTTMPALGGGGGGGVQLHLQHRHDVTPGQSHTTLLDTRMASPTQLLADAGLAQIVCNAAAAVEGAANTIATAGTEESVDPSVPISVLLGSEAPVDLFPSNPSQGGAGDDTTLLVPTPPPAKNSKSPITYRHTVRPGEAAAAVPPAAQTRFARTPSPQATRAGLDSRERSRSFPNLLRVDLHHHHHIYIHDDNGIAAAHGLRGLGAGDAGALALTDVAGAHSGGTELAPVATPPAASSSSDAAVVPRGFWPGTANFVTSVLTPLQKKVSSNIQQTSTMISPLIKKTFEDIKSDLIGQHGRITHGRGDDLQIVVREVVDDDDEYGAVEGAETEAGGGNAAVADAEVVDVTSPPHALSPVTMSGTANTAAAAGEGAGGASVCAAPQAPSASRPAHPLASDADPGTSPAPVGSEAAPAGTDRKHDAPLQPSDHRSRVGGPGAGGESPRKRQVPQGAAPLVHVGGSPGTGAGVTPPPAAREAIDLESTFSSDIGGGGGFPTTSSGGGVEPWDPARASHRDPAGADSECAPTPIGSGDSSSMHVQAMARQASSPGHPKAAAGSGGGSGTPAGVSITVHEVTTPPKPSPVHTPPPPAPRMSIDRSTTNGGDDGGCGASTGVSEDGFLHAGAVGETRASPFAGSSSQGGEADDIDRDHMRVSAMGQNEDWGPRRSPGMQPVGHVHAHAHAHPVAPRDVEITVREGWAAGSNALSVAAAAAQQIPASSASMPSPRTMQQQQQQAHHSTGTPGGGSGGAPARTSPVYDSPRNPSSDPTHVASSHPHAAGVQQQQQQQQPPHHYNPSMHPGYTGPYYSPFPGHPMGWPPQGAAPHVQSTGDAQNLADVTVGDGGFADFAAMHRVASQPQPPGYGSAYPHPPLDSSTSSLYPGPGPGAPGFMSYGRQTSGGTSPLVESQPSIMSSLHQTNIKVKVEVEGAKFQFNIKPTTEWHEFIVILCKNCGPVVPSLAGVQTERELLQQVRLGWIDDEDDNSDLMCDVHFKTFVEGCLEHTKPHGKIVMARKTADIHAHTHHPTSQTATPSPPPPAPGRVVGDDIGAGGRDGNASGRGSASSSHGAAGEGIMGPPITSSFRWTQGKLLGRGSYGEVWSALDQKTGKTYAVKKMCLPRNEESDRRAAEIAHEIKLLSHLDHPNIVRFIGTQRSARGGDYLYIFMEYMDGGSVAAMARQYGTNRTGLHSRVIQNYTQQILRGLQYLHDNKVIHRDIKGDNILVDHLGHCKLADFGASKIQAGDATTTASGLRGTVVFFAPEIINGSRYSAASDVWAVGCTLIEMATGRPPWNDVLHAQGKEQLQPLQIYYRIDEYYKRGCRPPYPSSVSPAFNAFLDRCFHFDARARPSAEELLEMDFVRVQEQAGPAGQSTDEHREEDFFERVHETADFATLSYPDTEESVGATASMSPPPHTTATTLTSVTPGAPVAFTPPSGTAFRDTTSLSMTPVGSLHPGAPIDNKNDPLHSFY